MNYGDVRVIDRGCGPRFSEDMLIRSPGEELQRHRSVEDGIAGTIDPAHSSGADQLQVFKAFDLHRHRGHSRAAERIG